MRHVILVSFAGFQVDLSHVDSLFQISVHCTNVQDLFTVFHLGSFIYSMLLSSVHDMIFTIHIVLDGLGCPLRLRLLLSVRNVIIFYRTADLGLSYRSGRSCARLATAYIFDILLLSLGFGASCAHRCAHLLLAARLLDRLEKAGVASVESAVVEGLSPAADLVLHRHHHLSWLAATATCGCSENGVGVR